jgi:uncharacterized protein
MPKHESINYLEFPCRNIPASKTFFQTCFGWEFTDYGPDYTAFSHPNIDGGFYTSELSVSAESGSVLVVLFSDQLEATLEKVQSCGGLLVKPIFSFPGGRRFHFTDPSGNEFAVWSDV